MSDCGARIGCSDRIALTGLQCTIWICQLEGTIIKLGMHKMELGDSVYAAERIMKKRTRKVSPTPCDSVHNVLTKPEIIYRPPNMFDSLLCYSFAILTLSLHPNIHRTMLRGYQHAVGILIRIPCM